MHFPWTCQILWKIYQELHQDGQTTNLLTHQKAEFEWTPIHHTAFLTLKESVTQTPILHYPDQQNGTCSTQMHQMMRVEHNYHKKMMEQNSP